MQNLLKYKKLDYQKIISYGVIGVIGTIVHFSTLILLVELFGVDPVIGSLAGFILTVILSFLLNKTYTFKVRNRNNMILFIKYGVVSVVGFVMNYLIMYLTVDIYSLHYAIGQAMVVICIPITNFLLNNYWTFQQQ
ncbi:GtrA family protein [Alkalihalobacillus sp. AL-G]|uniref:GtrA family protein n=1 Tax=Alkalihalobacillus sp. AL-G TaxID=2926399 RepID=UPI00272C4E72|nr:GtrA family protein [Alkalihalobacillus sp. AL-G]WLD93928.1 GtrA family protein [Alkalihalobacillus sp. AL-G]